MRAYIRHPSEFPIELGRDDHPACDRLSDVSIGGLSCHSPEALGEGERVKVRIAAVQPPFEAEGRVVWCRRDKERYRVGIAFADEARAFSARMVEQVCHIERYRNHLQAQGQELSIEDAASEWIRKYAAKFPR
jgi:PilZ domain